MSTANRRDRLTGMTFSRQQIVQGTGWPRGVRFAVVKEPRPENPSHAESLALLREVLEALSEITIKEFSRGGDREIRIKIARHLGLNEEGYSL